MKVIISHDVDHLTVCEHKKDLIVPKFLIRSLIELLLRKISFKEYFLRFSDIIKNKWNNILELAEFDKLNNIPSTFFFAMNNGLGISYSIKQTEFFIKYLKENKFDCGVHGIEFNDPNKIFTEYDNFKRISNIENFGIRMHYLRIGKNTLEHLSKIGYLFDSSVFEDKNPYKINYIWEFPLHIMDGYVIEGKGKKWQSNNLEKSKDITIKIIDNLIKKDNKYLTILFHDRYFSDSFLTWKKWYIWLVEYLKSNNFEFISYKDAIKEMENKI